MRLLRMCGVVFAGCVGSSGSQTAESVAPPQVTEHVTVAFAGANRHPLGASCDLSGAAECLSGICLQFSHSSPNDGHRCSQACSTQDCADGWHCVQLAPGSDFCVPNEVVGGVDQ